MLPSSRLGEKQGKNYLYMVALNIHTRTTTRKLRVTWLIRRRKLHWHKLNIEAQAVVKLSSTCTFSTGEGNITVNERDVREYLPFESLILDLNQPFDVTETKGNYDVLVNVHGGGFTGQAQAIRHGIARALLEADPEYRGSLKRAGLLTRDPRMKERKNQVLKSTSFSTILKTLMLELLQTCLLTSSVCKLRQQFVFN